MLEYRMSVVRAALVAGGLATLVAVSGCTQTGGGPAQPGLGTLGGAAVGGVLGSTVGSGTGRTVAIAGGALLGGIAGNQLVDRPVERRQIAEREVERDREMQRQLDFERMSALQQEQVEREIREQRLYEEWRSQRMAGASLTGADDISEAQRLLTAHGLYRGPISGTNGPQTQAAVRAFQRNQGLPETGQITSSLVNLMRATL